MVVDEKLAPFASRAIRSFMPEQHREFFRALPFVIVAARRADGAPVVTSLSGGPGFVDSPSSTRLTVGTAPGPGDPLQGQIHAGSEVGLLGIELHTRRRNRENGVVSKTGGGGGGFSIDVIQSFGNCKQYVTERFLRPRAPRGETAEVSPALGARAISLIENADTFFLGSGAPGFGLDASHRGGPPGFVRVDSPNALVFPDYSGNNFFNTVGNLMRDARVALLFIDFEEGHLLHVLGRATIDWGSLALSEFPNAARLINVDVTETVFREGAFGLSTSSPRDGAEASRQR